MTAPATMRERFVDQLDARAVLANVAVAVVLSFVLQNPLYLAALAAALWLVLTSIARPRTYAPYLAFGSFAALGVMLLNPLVSRAGQTILWHGPTVALLGQLDLTAESIAFGVGMGLRLLCVVAAFALYSLTADPDAIYRLVAPFSAGSALVTALSIRLFPTTVRDASRIMDAQRSRGLKLDTGSWRTRAAARVPVMDALLMTSLERAMGVAEALESRGYGRPGRTRRPAEKLTRRDALLLAFAAVTLAFGAWLALGPARFAYYPVLGDPTRASDAVLALALATLVCLPVALGWGWTRWHWLRSRT